MHKHLEFLRAEIDDTAKRWSPYMDRATAGKMAGDGRYSYSHRHVTDEMEELLSGLCGGSKDSFWAIGHHLDSMGDAIKKIRNIRRGHPSDVEYEPMREHREKSATMFDYISGRCFPRANIKARTGGVHAETENPGNKYSARHYVSVGIGWYRSVGSKGIGMIRAGDGIRCVLYARQNDVGWVADEKMVCFNVTTLSIKHNKSTVEDGWLVVHEDTLLSEHDPLMYYGDRTVAKPHAYNANLRKAVSLLKSRTFNRLVDMLDDI
jgi:hypothetical protein